MKNEDRMDEVNVCCIVTLTRLRCSPGEHYTVDHQMIVSIRRTPTPWQQTKAVLTIPLLLQQPKMAGLLCGLSRRLKHHSQDQFHQLQLHMQVVHLSGHPDC